MTLPLSARVKMTQLFISLIKILVFLAKSNNFLSTSLRCIGDNAKLFNMGMTENRDPLIDK